MEITASITILYSDKHQQILFVDGSNTYKKWKMADNRQFEKK